MTLTPCADCRFFDRRGTAGFCRRHAPATSVRAFEVARWPETRASDACGEGRPRQDDSPDVPPCGECVFWYRPGIGIDPAQRGDRQRAWWDEAGFCRRLAPHPGADIGHHAFWRVTHSDESCAEGRRP